MDSGRGASKSSDILTFPFKTPNLILVFASLNFESFATGLPPFVRIISEPVSISSINLAKGIFILAIFIVCLIILILFLSSYAFLPVEFDLCVNICIRIKYTLYTIISTNKLGAQLYPETLYIGIPVVMGLNVFSCFAARFIPARFVQ